MLVDRDIIVAKASYVKRHLVRIREKRNVSLEIFLEDTDRQESILFNLQMAIQGCIDIASHIISEEGLGVPGSMSEMFYLLEEDRYIDRAVTEKMVRAVGFRNLIIHEYARIELQQVFRIAQKNIDDLNEYLVAIFNKLGLN